MDDTTRVLFEALDEKLRLLMKERDHYRSVLSDMTISRDSQTRVDAAQAIHAGDKIRRGRVAL